MSQVGLIILGLVAATALVISGLPLTYVKFPEPLTEPRFDAQQVQLCRLDWLKDGCNISVIFDGYHLTQEQIQTAEMWLKEYFASRTTPWLNRTQIERGERLEECFHARLFNDNFRLFECYAYLLVDYRLGKYKDENLTHVFNQAMEDYNHSISVPLPSTTTTTTTPVPLPDYPILSRCPPQEPMMDLWFDHEPSQYQKEFCWRNPALCPMRISLWNLNINQKTVELLDGWREYFLQVDPCGGDRGGSSSGDSSDNVDPQLIRALQLFACIKGELAQPHSILPCVSNLLKENHFTFDQGRQSGQQSEVIDVHKWIKSHPKETYNATAGSDEDYSLDYHWPNQG